MFPDTCRLVAPLHPPGLDVDNAASATVPKAAQGFMDTLLRSAGETQQPLEGILSDRLFDAEKELSGCSLFKGARNKAFILICQTQIAMEESTGEALRDHRHQQMIDANAFLEDYGHGKWGNARLVRLVEEVKAELIGKADIPRYGLEHQGEKVNYSRFTHLDAQIKDAERKGKSDDEALLFLSVATSFRYLMTGNSPAPSRFMGNILEGADEYLTEHTQASSANRTRAQAVRSIRTFLSDLHIVPLNNDMSQRRPSSTNNASDIAAPSQHVDDPDVPLHTVGLRSTRSYWRRQSDRPVLELK